MQLRKIQELDMTGKKVFLRLDLNVPIKDGKIQDDTRILESLPTLKFILEQTNKIVIASHLGRPKDAPDPKYSLEPVGAKLAELLNMDVVFVDDYMNENPAHLVNKLEPKQIMLLENLRFHPGETKNSPAFAEHLADGFDFYVNDAFGTVHRAHASVVGIPEQLPEERRAAGLLIQKEVDALSSLMTRPEAPFTVIMGGSKVSDKIAVILNLLTRCNNLIIGGAMAYTFLRFKGVNVGKSRIEGDKLDLVDKIFKNAEARRVKIYLPEDHVGAREFVEGVKAEPIDTVNIPDHLMGLDIGPKTAKAYAEVIRSSRTVLWNGPMGVFEWPAFAAGSHAVAKAMAACTGKTVIGGGDSVSAANQAGVAESISHVSTGGGASLEFLEGQTLPGLKILTV